MNLLCVLVDNKKTLIGHPFSVSVADDAIIADVKNQVKAAWPDSLLHVSAGNLVVLRPTDSPDFPDESKEAQAKLKEIYKGDKFVMLRAAAGVNDLKIGRTEVLIVQIDIGTWH